MIGVTKDEGLLFTAILNNALNARALLKSNWTQCLAANILGIPRANMGDDVKEMVRQTEHFYGLKPAEVEDEKNLRLLADAFTDSNFAFPVERMARPMLANNSRRSPTWIYRFDHLGGISLVDMIMAGASAAATILVLLQSALGFFTPSKLGVCHGDDLFYLFSPKMPLGLQGEDLRMSRLMVDLWANFAEFRDPTPDVDGQYVGEFVSSSWPPAKILPDGHLQQMCLANAQMKAWEDEGEKKRMAFWRRKTKN